MVSFVVLEQLFVSHKRTIASRAVSCRGMAKRRLVLLQKRARYKFFRTNPADIRQCETVPAVRVQSKVGDCFKSFTTINALENRIAMGCMHMRLQQAVQREPPITAHAFMNRFHCALVCPVVISITQFFCRFPYVEIWVRLKNEIAINK
jgi:hypothetical protein